MKHVNYFMFLCILSGLIHARSHAQDMNDEMKKRLHESLIMPQKKKGEQLQQSQNALSIFLEHENETLKVSPDTKLPTKIDRLKILPYPEEYKIYLVLYVTNSTPVNQRPRGSVTYEFIGKELVIIPTAGEMVYPTGFGPGPIRKRHKKNDNILKPLQK